MEWNIKQEDLKVKCGKKLPLRISPNANYSTLREKAGKKWKNCHSNFYDESQIYHLLHEDGQKATSLPGSNESFSLCHYQEELDIELKCISFFLCSNHDYLTAADVSDDEEHSSRLNVTNSWTECYKNLMILQIVSLKSTMSAREALMI